MRVCLCVQNHFRKIEYRLKYYISRFSSFGVRTVQKIVFADGYDDDNIVVTIPAKALDSIGTVVVLEIKCQ